MRTLREKEMDLSSSLIYLCRHKKLECQSISKNEMYLDEIDIILRGVFDCVLLLVTIAQRMDFVGYRDTCRFCWYPVQDGVLLCCVHYSCRL